MSKHLHQHPLIPTVEGQYFSSTLIWTRAVNEIYNQHLDLVVFVIVEQVIPYQQRRFEQIFVVKREKADWRKSFKKEWKELSTQTINNSYLTDINNWICGCPYFLKSHFLFVN